MRQTFGDRLKDLRTEHGMTMDEFIIAINLIYPNILMNKSTISRYEQNINKPKHFDIVESFAEFFKVDINYMMGKSNDKYGEETEYKKIPVLGAIAAGIPILAQEDIRAYEYIDVDEDITFCLKVKGDSMINARIFDGDIVYIRRQPDIENGQIAAVQINDEVATLKRVYKVDGNIILRPENNNYSDMIFSKKDMKEIKILGRAMFFKSEVK